MNPNSVFVSAWTHAAGASTGGASRLVLGGLLLVLLSGCAGIVDKPTRATIYDFGPGPVTEVQQPAPVRPALVLADVEAAATLEGSALLYRLGYVDDHELRPYAQARWGAPPPQLVRERLRERIGRERIVLNPGEGAALARTGDRAPHVLRLELEEFSHFFRSPAESFGLVRLRATLLENTPGGEKVLSQHNVVVQRPAPSADASGGARALTAAVDGAADDLMQWLAQHP
jgi:cholesterol transport system auxiliary component